MDEIICHLQKKTRYLLWNMTARDMSIVASILDITANNIVAVVWLRDLVVGVHTDLQDEWETVPWVNRPDSHTHIHTRTLPCVYYILQTIQMAGKTGN